MIFQFRAEFNRKYRPHQYLELLELLERQAGVRVEFRVAETPVFIPRTLLDQMAADGEALAKSLIKDPPYLEKAAEAIPEAYRVAGLDAHPHFLTADFALVQGASGDLTPRLVEIQAFPSVYGYQPVLAAAYRQIFDLEDTLVTFLSGLTEESYWKLLSQTILGDSDPEDVILTEIDPGHQKTRPDFEITSRKTGIAVVDIASLEVDGNRLFRRNAAGKLVPIKRIYNRAIADELIARNVQLPFDLTRDWDVTWAGHPNWYFLISKFSIPFLCQGEKANPVVPPAVFLRDFLAGPGREQLAASGVPLPGGSDAVYDSLLLKPLFSFAGKGIRFDPTQRELESVPESERGNYMLQQRMQFAPTIETPHGLTQAEIRILYLWPEKGTLTPAISLVRLGRGKMMGVDHNRNQEWVGASAAFSPTSNE